MVTFPPFAASAEWYAEWLAAARRGASGADAILQANAAVGAVGKDFSRAGIGSGGRETLLSMAVEGGASVLKRKGGPESALLSDHGNWRHAHLGAFEAVYGRTPYYQHFMPMLREVYASGEIRLGRFNTAIHQAVCDFLGIDGNLRQAPAHLSAPVRERSEELRALLIPGNSIIDAAMRLGPETLLAITAHRQD